MSWHALKTGDKVRIIAPGAQTSTAWADLEKCCQFLADFKLTPVYSKTIFATTTSYYPFANTDDARYNDFVDALQSDAAAIWCFRGGYGSDRVLARLVLNHITPKDATKLFIGFSDITNFHSYINTRWGWNTLHAAALKQFGLKQIQSNDVEITKNIILGNIQKIELPLTPLNDAAKQADVISAKITGGNLTTIQCAIGTAWETPSQNTILLLEDVGEAPYRVARMLQQFLLNGYLQKTCAVILGDFISKEPAMGLALQEFAMHCPLPVLRYEGIGHGSKNHPIPLGPLSHLTLGEQPRLVVETGATY
jgi:muramoyltetrapeptide carboxypeptidase